MTCAGLWLHCAQPGHPASIKQNLFWALAQRLPSGGGDGLSVTDPGWSGDGFQLRISSVERFTFAGFDPYMRSAVK